MLCPVPHRQQVPSQHHHLMYSRAHGRAPCSPGPKSRHRTSRHPPGCPRGGPGLRPAPPCHVFPGPWPGPSFPRPQTKTPNQRLHLHCKPERTRSVDAYQWIGRQAAHSLGPLLGPRLHATRSVATGSTRAARLRCLTALNAHGVVHKHKGPTCEHMPKQARSCWEAMQCGCMPLKYRSQHACGECSQAHACLCGRLCHCFFLEYVSPRLRRSARVHIRVRELSMPLRHSPLGLFLASCDSRSASALMQSGNLSQPLSPQAH